MRLGYLSNKSVWNFRISCVYVAQCKNGSLVYKVTNQGNVWYFRNLESLMVFARLWFGIKTELKIKGVNSSF
jgi:hypothetical protein